MIHLKIGVEFQNEIWYNIFEIKKGAKNQMMELKWEEVNIELRRKVWSIYRRKLYAAEGWYISFEQVDYNWTGSSWYLIKYTFGIEGVKL